MARSGARAELMAGLAVAVVSEPLWHRVPGGTGRATRELIDGLHGRSDVELVTVSARHRRSNSRDGNQVPRQWLLPRVALYEAWARSGGRPGSTRVCPDVDLVHSPMLPAPRRGDRPLVVTLHDLTFLEQPETFPARPRRLYERLWRLIRDEADIVICSSEATLAAAIENGLAERRARAVPLGASVPKVTQSDQDQVMMRHNLANPYVLFVGTAEPRKNLGRLLRAYAQSGLADDNVELVIVGPGGWRQKLGDLVDELSPAVNTKVRSLGEVPENELHALYAGASAFCYPSLVEGFGLPVLEAMAHGTPVVTSRHTAPAEIVADAGVLIDPLDEADLAAAMVGLLADPSRAAELGRAGQSRASEYTWERHIDLTVAIYRELLS